LEEATHHIVDRDYHVTVREANEGKVGRERLLRESKKLLGVLHGEGEPSSDLKVRERIKS
jgi:hypothetical protein